MKAFIFDLDGVIVHTDHYHYLAWKKIAKKLKIDFNELDNNRLRGIGRMESLEILLEKYHGSVLSKQVKERLATEKNNYYREYLMELTSDDVDPSVKETLQYLKNNEYALAIGSSSKNARLILEKTQMIDLFDAISDGTIITKSKPDPEVFLNAAKQLGIEPKDCYVVEDASSGIQAAKNAKMTAIGIGNCLNPQECDYLIQSFVELKTMK